MSKIVNETVQNGPWEVPGSLYESISTEMAVYYYQQSEKRMAEVISVSNKIHERSYTLLGLLLVILPIIVALSFKSDLLVVRLVSLLMVLLYAGISIGLFNIMRPKNTKTITSDPRYSINEKVHDYIKKKNKVTSVGLKEITLYEVEKNQKCITSMHEQNEKLASKYDLLLRSVYASIVVQLLVAAISFVL